MVFSYANLNKRRFMQCVLNIHEVVTALFDCYVAIATASVSAQVLCTSYNHTPVYSVTLFKATYVGCVHVWL